MCHLLKMIEWLTKVDFLTIIRVKAGILKGIQIISELLCEKKF